MKKGFTLIEVIIYISLFSLLMGTVFVTAFQLIQSSGNLSNKNTIQEEGNFVMRKLDWALTGINPSSVLSLSGASCAQTLTITKTAATINPILITLQNVGGINYIEIQEHGGVYHPITTSNVLPSCLTFTLISGSPMGVTIKATLNGVDFTLTKYIRK